MSSLKKTVPGENLVKFILKLSPLEKISQSFVFTYKGQRPNLALFLSDGEVRVGVKKVLAKSKSSGYLLFLPELLSGSIIKDNIEVMSGSLVSVIDKNTAEEILEFTCINK